ncbi:MAG: type II toxin-antitoxin system HicB family antitoxin, partial [Acidobacteriota bacterium]
STVTYNFKVIVEPDGDRWHAYCPALVSAGAATWGYTREEALRNIQLRKSGQPGSQADRLRRSPKKHETELRSIFDCSSCE